MRYLLLLALLLSACGGIVAEDPPAMPEDPLEHVVRAICACGNPFAGCPANVRSEYKYGNPACLVEWAETYERSCTGRPQPTCKL